MPGTVTPSYERKRTTSPGTRSSGATPGARALRRGVRLPEARSSRSEEHTSELQSLMRISYAVFCLKKKSKQDLTTINKYDKVCSLTVEQYNTNTTYIKTTYMEINSNTAKTDNSKHKI